MFIGSRRFLGSVPAFASAQGALPPLGPFGSDLLQAAEKISLVNTHEHIIPDQERTSSQVDFFTLAGHYAINDVIHAGVDRRRTGAGPRS